MAGCLAASRLMRLLAPPFRPWWLFTIITWPMSMWKRPSPMRRDRKTRPSLTPSWTRRSWSKLTSSSSLNVGSLWGLNPRCHIADFESRCRDGRCGRDPVQRVSAHHLVRDVLASQERGGLFRLRARLCRRAEERDIGTALVGAIRHAGATGRAQLPRLHSTNPAGSGEITRHVYAVVYLCLCGDYHHAWPFARRNPCWKCRWSGIMCTSPSAPSPSPEVRNWKLPWPLSASWRVPTPSAACKAPTIIFITTRLTRLITKESPTLDLLSPLFKVFQSFDL